MPRYVPNLITSIRLLGAPFIFILLNQNKFIWALTLFLVCIISDFFDGYVARKFNAVTDFGRYWDPICDKALLFTLLLAFVNLGVCPAWYMALIITVHLIKLVGLVVLFTSPVPRPSFTPLSIGKWNIAIQFFLIAQILLSFLIFKSSHLPVWLLWYFWSSFILLSIFQVLVFLCYAALYRAPTVSGLTALLPQQQ